MEFFPDNSQVKRLPPEQTRILDLRVDPYPDRQRLRVVLELTPFQKRPSIELTVTDPQGASAGSANIIEPMAWKLELTLHLRKEVSPAGKYSLLARLSYPDLDEADRRETTFELHAPTK